MLGLVRAEAAREELLRNFEPPRELPLALVDHPFTNSPQAEKYETRFPGQPWGYRRCDAREARIETPEGRWPRD